MTFPTVRTDLVVSPRPNGDGVLVYDPTTDVGHVLEGVAAIVFTSCNGMRDRDGILREVTSATGSPADLSVVDDAMDQLRDAGLLGGPRGISRRVLIGGLIAGAAAVAVAPLVTSVAKPAAATAFAPSSEDRAMVPVSATTTAGTAVQIPLSSIGLDPATTVYWNVTQPANGVVTVTNTSADGANTGAYATYTPNPGFTGSDSFDYTAGVCTGIGAYLYPAPPSAQDSCPAATFVNGSTITAATVSITVNPVPVPEPEDSTPKFTG